MGGRLLYTQLLGLQYLLAAAFKPTNPHTESSRYLLTFSLYARGQSIVILNRGVPAGLWTL